MTKDKKNAGFTLIEISVVVLIMGIILLRTVPRLESLLHEKDADLKKSINLIVGTVKHLHRQAALTKKILCLNYHVNENEFWLTSLGEGKSTSGEDILISPKKLTLFGEVEFKDIINPPNSPIPGKKVDGESLTQFFPNGMADRTIIHLEDRSSEKLYTLIIKPLTGGVEIHEKYVDEVIL